jgi:hypothetical protein
MTRRSGRRCHGFPVGPTSNSLIALSSALLCVALPAAPSRAQETAAPLTREELERALQQRDAVIRELMRRVEQLERGAAPGAGPTPPAAPTAEAPAPPAPGERAPQTAETKAPAPGQVVVDQQAAERALEATLVQKGALLLPFGSAEFTPTFTYTRRSDSFPTVIDVPGGQAVIEQDVRRNEFEFLGSLRVGLPLDSQIELSMPYNLVDQSVANKSNGAPFEQSSDTGHGLGDVTVGLAKTVLQEAHWWPDVILRVDWDTGTGDKSNNDVALNGGFQSLTGSVSLTKRQDPLVFVGGAFYESVFEDDNIDPGDRYGFNVGTFLAASPQTSLYAVLNQSFINELKVDGNTVDGSDRVESVLSFGASAILGRNVLLDGSVGVGLTDDAPDYSVSISLPIRFSTPGM